MNNYVDDGQNYKCTESSDEYIDDYYAASMVQPQRFVPQNSGQLEVIREQSVSITSAQPSTISSSDAKMNSASVNIAVLGQSSLHHQMRGDITKGDSQHLYNFSFDREETIF